MQGTESQENKDPSCSLIPQNVGSDFEASRPQHGRNGSQSEKPRSTFDAVVNPSSGSQPSLLHALNDINFSEAQQHTAINEVSEDAEASTARSYNAGYPELQSFQNFAPYVPMNQYKHVIEELDNNHSDEENRDYSNPSDEKEEEEVKIRPSFLKLHENYAFQNARNRYVPKQGGSELENREAEKLHQEEEVERRYDNLQTSDPFAIPKNLKVLKDCPSRKSSEEDEQKELKLTFNPPKENWIPRKDSDEQRRETINFSEESRHNVHAGFEDFADDDSPLPLLEESMKRSSILQNPQENFLLRETSNPNGFQISISNAKKIGGIHYYEIIYKTGREEWTVERRYNHFKALYEKFLNLYPGYIIPSLPPENISENVMEKVGLAGDRFIGERKKGLLYFLIKVLMHRILRESSELQRFLCDKSFESFERNPTLGGFAWSVFERVRNFSFGDYEEKSNITLFADDTKLRNRQILFATYEKNLTSMIVSLKKFFESEEQRTSTIPFLLEKFQEIKSYQKGGLEAKMLGSFVLVEEKNLGTIQSEFRNQLIELLADVQAVNNTLKFRITKSDELAKETKMRKDKILQDKKNELIKLCKPNEEEEQIKRDQDSFHLDNETLFEEVEREQGDIERRLTDYSYSFTQDAQYAQSIAQKFWKHQKETWNKQMSIQDEMIEFCE